MKKIKVISSLFIAAFLCMSTISCSHKAVKNNAVKDSVVVSDSDSTSVDSLSIDSTAKTSAVVK